MRRWLLLALVACSAPPPARPAAGEPVPPIAARRPYDVVSPHGTRSDPYYWLRDRDDPAVRAYLAAENAYARAVLAPVQPLEDALVAEARARLDEEATTLPVLEDGYLYYERHVRGGQHPIHARRRAPDGPEEVLLDGNALAAGKAFYAIGDHAVSRDGKLLAWTDDEVGRLQYTLHVKDLASGRVLPDTLANLAPTVVWGNDGRTLFVVGRDPTTLREERVIRHTVGGGDELVYREADAAFYVDVGVTKSRRYITIELDATTTSETRLVDADRPAAAPVVFWPRAADRVYELDHLDGRFVVRTNDAGDNFRVVAMADGDQADPRAWRTVIAHRADTVVEEIAVYRGSIAAGIRRDGLARVRVVPERGAAFEVAAGDPTFAMALEATPDPAATRVRYAYDSLTTPHAIFEVDPASGARTEVWRERVPAYEPARYTSEYVWAPARDGVRVPVSIVRRADTPRDGTAPLLLTAYGAYGESLEPRFDRERASLLDRGWVIAIAHVRGGGELGEAWYEAGRALAKPTTFADFIAVTEYLVAQRHAGAVYVEGASAGGLLVAAVANLRPELYRGMIAWVPFVDVVTTMLDGRLPLVTNEYDEWGDPRDAEAYRTMLAYSPYDNVRAQAYPALYVRSGIADGLVPFHEPAKWVAKLRATKTDRRPLVFEIDMHAGHVGTSGRYDAIREQARAYAFLLGLAQ